MCDPLLVPSWPVMNFIVACLIIRQNEPVLTIYLDSLQKFSSNSRFIELDVTREVILFIFKLSSDHIPFPTKFDYGIVWIVRRENSFT